MGPVYPASFVSRQATPRSPNPGNKSAPEHSPTTEKCHPWNKSTPKCSLTTKIAGEWKKSVFPEENGDTKECCREKINKGWCKTLPSLQIFHTLNLNMYPIYLSPLSLTTGFA